MKMKSSVMGSLEFQFPHLGFLQNLSKPHPRCSSMVTCGLRGGPRKPLWRKSVLSSETIQVVHSLKLAKASTSRLQQVFSGRLSRLLKADLLDTLAELHRQNELDLALKVYIAHSWLNINCFCVCIRIYEHMLVWLDAPLSTAFCYEKC